MPALSYVYSLAPLSAYILKIDHPSKHVRLHPLRSYLEILKRMATFSMSREGSVVDI